MGATGWNLIFSPRERGGDGGASRFALSTPAPLFNLADVPGAGSMVPCAPRTGSRHVGNRRGDVRVAARRAPVLVRLAKPRLDSTLYIKHKHLFVFA